jgi:TM2 domain
MTDPLAANGDVDPTAPALPAEPQWSSVEPLGQSVSGAPTVPMGNYPNPVEYQTPPYPPVSYPPPVPAYPPVGYPSPPAPAAYPYAGSINPNAPYGYDPVTGRPMSDKSKLAAGLLQIFLPGFAVGRFYTGHTSLALGQLGVFWGATLLTCCGTAAFSTVTLGLGSPSLIFVPVVSFLASLWPIIDGILLLARGGTDSQGRVLRA